MSSYNTIGGEEGTLLTRPLFGQQTLWRKVADWASFGVTGMLTLVTFLGAIFKSDVNDTVHTKSYNIYFALCLALLSASHFVLLIWYRQGDVDPKFRYLIFSNTVLIILLNVCADLYIFAL